MGGGNLDENAKMIQPAFLGRGKFFGPPFSGGPGDGMQGCRVEVPPPVTASYPESKKHPP
jgi:hypothetical protein